VRALGGALGDAALAATIPPMLNELRPTRVSFDLADQSTLIETGAAKKGSPTAVSGTLLLGSEGHLVGVDLRGSSGVVVMLGEHEEVAKTQDVTGDTLRVALDEKGQPAEIRVRGARARGSEMAIL
jgi:hypothetical protein